MSTINIPELSLVMLIGTSGSGKSTFARTHFKTTEVLSSDYCRGLVSDDENDQSATKEAFDVLHFIASKRLTAGKLVVVDATNVLPESRKSLVALARRHHVIPVAIVLNLSRDLCHQRNSQRPDRQFGKQVVWNQYDQLRRSLKGLKREGISQAYVLNSVEEVAAVSIQRTPLWNNRKHIHGPFDLIGDVHGCFDELCALMGQLGYQIDSQDGHYQVSHPQERKLVLVGDLVDRGPKTPEVLRLVMDMVNSGTGFCVLGNHDDKLKRKLQGRDVTVAHGLAESLAQLADWPAEFVLEATGFLDGLISHYVFDDGKLAVAHAGLKQEYIGRGSPRIREFCMYGETTGEIDEFGLPVRYPWARDYRGNTLVVHGHTPVPSAEWLNNTINLDTGCVFGGKLTALRYPEKELVSVAAARVYMEPARPLLPAHDARDGYVLDMDDVGGKRIINTSLKHNIIIREENAQAALEVMSRYAIDPRWLIYLPPTMSPSETSAREELLEHPDEAFAYYRSHGVAQLICEEKHMGSRAIVVICRDNDTARQRFGISGDEIGVCYTRTGRSFFNNPALEQALLQRLHAAIGQAGLWTQLNSNWFCFDCELLPWSAKAMALLQQQYAPVGAAANAVLPKATALLQQAQAISGVSELLEKFSPRSQMVADYRDAYRRYCWDVQDIGDYKLAPFHLLAGEGLFNFHQDHHWHLELINQLCAADPDFIHATAWRQVEVNDANSCTAAVDWWQQLTANGGEGMVVKPLAFTAKDEHGLLQPGIKCRGREYLRIIYGPEYTAPHNLSRLRKRGLGAKRNLALREYALGYEALQRFVNGEPLHRVHEAVFGVLALESEVVDPRL